MTFVHRPEPECFEKKSTSFDYCDCADLMYAEALATIDSLRSQLTAVEAERSEVWRDYCAMRRDRDGQAALAEKLESALATTRSALERAEKRAEDPEDWVNKLSTQVRFAEAERDEWKRGWENAVSALKACKREAAIGNGHGVPKMVDRALAALDREGERPATQTEWVDVGTHDDPYFVKIPAPTDRERGPTDGE